MSSNIDAEDLLRLIDREDIVRYLEKRGVPFSERETETDGPVIDEAFMGGSALAVDLIDVLVDLREKYDLRLVEKLRELLAA